MAEFITEKKIKQITVKLPDTGTFILAFPCPTRNLIDLSDYAEEFLIDSDGLKIAVLRIDYWKYPIGAMSNFMCQLAYGEDPEWVKAHLKGIYKQLTDESFIAFFLFKHLAEPPKKL